MFYTYRQNNSYGRFEGEYDLICIEADSTEEADSIAERETGIYFAEDCPCCGPRWTPANDWSSYEFPSDYGEVDISMGPREPFWLNEGMKTLVVYKDGIKKEY